MQVKSHSPGTAGTGTAVRRVNGSVDQKKKEEEEREGEGDDHRIDKTGEFEFCGVWGTGFVMVFFPLLMWYMWVGQVYYGAQFPTPESGEGIGAFVSKVAGMAYEVRDDIEFVSFFLLPWNWGLFADLMGCNYPGWGVDSVHFRV